MSQRRRFSAQYKDEAVQLVIQSGRPIAQVARELGINDGTLGNWVNAWRMDNPEKEQPLTVVERARLREMEDENRRLKMENEFLKKYQWHPSGGTRWDENPFGGWGSLRWWGDDGGGGVARD